MFISNNYFYLSKKTFILLLNAKFQSFSENANWCIITTIDNLSNVRSNFTLHNDKDNTVVQQRATPVCVRVPVLVYLCPCMDGKVQDPFQSRVRDGRNLTMT